MAGDTQGFAVGEGVRPADRFGRDVMGVPSVLDELRVAASADMAAPLPRTLATATSAGPCLRFDFVRERHVVLLTS